MNYHLQGFGNLLFSTSCHCKHFFLRHFDNLCFIQCHLNNSTLSRVPPETLFSLLFCFRSLLIGNFFLLLLLSSFVLSTLRQESLYTVSGPLEIIHNEIYDEISRFQSDRDNITILDTIALILDIVRTANKTFSSSHDKREREKKAFEKAIKILIVYHNFKILLSSSSSLFSLRSCIYFFDLLITGTVQVHKL